MSDVTKTVLVSLGERTRPVTFSGSNQALMEAILVVFKDVLGDQGVYLQLKDESWGGVFVDVQEQEIPDRGIIKAIRIRPPDEEKQQTVVSGTCV